MAIISLPVAGLSRQLTLTVLMGATVCLSAFCLTANAQSLTTQQLNQIRTQPAQVQQHFQNQPDAIKETPDPEAPPEPKVIDEQAQPSQDPSLTKVFPIERIEIDGLHLLSDAEVDAMVAPYQAKGEVSFVELQELSAELTQAIRDKGYVTSRVYIPPQKIQGGVVTLQAVEGTVGSIEFLEKRHFRDRAIEPRFYVGHGSLNNNSLLRRLRRINENPDINVVATLKAGQNPDETDIDLEPSYEQHPYHVGLFWDNLGRYQIGKKRLGTTLTHNNLLGFGDQLSNTVAFTRRSFSTVTRYTVPVGPWGTRFNMDHAHSQIKLGEDGLAALKIKSDVNIYSPYLSQELINTEHHQLGLDLGLDFKNVNTNGGGLKFIDRVRTLRTS